MNRELTREIERLTRNAARKREDLLRRGLRDGARRKSLTVAAGVLALSSAGAITTVITNVFGSTFVQVVAAISAAVSGIVSLLITSYYGDDSVLTMLTGSAKYLALRENVYRLVLQPDISDSDRFQRLSELQQEYASLDEKYSRFFSIKTSSASHSLDDLDEGALYSNQPPPVGRVRRTLF
jgi:hypothetical protein